MEEVQINIRCAKAVAERLREITKAERIKSGELLEKLLDCYQDFIKNLSTDTGIAETVKMLESLVMALESRFEESRAVGSVSMPEVDKMPVAADLVACVVADAGAEKGVVQAGKRQAVSDEEFDALVQKFGEKEGGDYLGIRKIVAAIRAFGFQATQERVGTSLERLRKG